MGRVLLTAMLHRSRDSICVSRNLSFERWIVSDYASVWCLDNLDP